MPCLVAIADCTYIGLTTASFVDFDIAQENTINQTADVLEDQLWPPFGFSDSFPEASTPQTL